jgi:Phosphodiester glycosidase
MSGSRRCSPNTRAKPNYRHLVVRFRYASVARFVRGSLFVTLLLFALAAAAQAEWKILSAESEPGRGGIEHRHVVVEDAAPGQRVAVDVAILSAKSTALRVIDNPDGQGLGAVMKREKCLGGVNGGYFDTEFKPIGLRVVDGRTFSPLRRARLITGILMQSDRGIDVVRVGEFSRTKRVIAAIQAGPFLVEGNKRIRGLNDSQLARRTFVGIATNDRALLGVCSDVSLAELANILATAPIAGDSKIRRAMNLDGGSSTAFWFARENGNAFSVPGQKPVRDFVGVVPK